MKKFIKVLAILLVILIPFVFAACSFLPVDTQAALTDENAWARVIEVVVQWGTLIGAAALVSVIVNLLKSIGVVKDGTADKWVAGVNLILLCFSVGFSFFKPDMIASMLDEKYQLASEILLIFGTFISQIVGAKTTYAATKGLPVVGYSNSGSG
jgi:hypothetical protein